MDMHAKPQDKHTDQWVFHLTGKRKGDGLAPIDGLDLRPALMAPYRDLGALRHDFPLVLANRGAGGGVLCSLSSLIDETLREVAPRGVEGERLRRHGLQIEEGIRRMVAAGTGGTLAELWDKAAAPIAAREGEALEQVLQRAGGALPADGQVLGCTAEMPAQVMKHLWRAAQREKARGFMVDLARLVQKLSDILRAAHLHSQSGREAGALKASIGGAHQAAFDFSALSRIVGKGAPRDELPPARRARVTWALGVLEAQRFHPHAHVGDAQGDASEVYDFIFDDCASAMKAFRERLPALAEVVKAMAIAELEIRGAYVEAEHDPFFEAFGENTLTGDELDRFPPYLVCIPPGRNDSPENASLMDMLSSGLPVKALVQTDDLFDESSIGTGHFAFGVRSARLATTAMGLGGMYVLQDAASNLVAVRDDIARGMACKGPALFSVFTGTEQPATHLPPYLLAAAAMQSRAFPAFCYDAQAGDNWAQRFSLENNPAPEDDWSVETLDYSDDALQRASATVAFTYPDYVFCDSRHASHFALVPRGRWGDDMMPVADWLVLPDAETSQRVPYLWVVDGNDVLQRVIVDARLMQATRRCLLLWHRLQEHGGVHDSHAERLLAKEKAAWAAAQQPQAAPAADAPAAAAPAPAAAEALAAEPEAAPEHSRDEAWIETARCPSCNECQLINDRMFGYTPNKQAFIKDLTAGTYRQLVEAAESCQVAIIHPGKPRDEKEPGLEELLARAEPFR